MAQRSRIRVSTITETKMFAKKMHRLVKKMQDKPADSLDPLEVLSEMARKRGENLAIPIEVETEVQWTQLLKREGLIVVDVYSGWSGPCTSMFSILRKLKLDTNDDRLIMAAANADHISQLAPFRNQSEPCWLFIGGGKPVKVLRGSNAPKLVRTIKSELQNEIDCINGKSKRNLISIKFEASRREMAVSEAIALDQLIVLEEEERKAKESSPPTSVPNEDMEKEDSLADKETLERDHTEDQDENEDSQEEKAETEEDKSNVSEEQMKERRKLMEESNVRLKETLRPFTVIAIQTYLLETGAVTEIKDHLSDDFKLVRERYINLNEEDARKLFGIPAEMPDPNPPTMEEHSTADETGEGEGNGGSGDHENAPSTTASPVPGHVNESESEKPEGDEHHGSDLENDDSLSLTRDKQPVIRMIAIPVPEVVIGDTLMLLLECSRVQPRDHDKNSEDNAEDNEIQDQNADFFMLQRIGPDDFEVATETQPESLHAMYGKEKFAAGIWCPRDYQEKRFVMLKYFPQFVTEMLMPPIPEPPKYQLFIFSALFSYEIMEHPEFVANKKDILAEKRTKIPYDVSEKMLAASKRKGESLRALKWALTGTELYIVSIDGRNTKFSETMETFKPIFVAKDAIEAGYFTSKIFPDVEVLLNEEPFLQLEQEHTPFLSSNLANLVVKIKEDLNANTDVNDDDKDKDKEESKGNEMNSDHQVSKDGIEIETAVEILEAEESKVSIVQEEEKDISIQEDDEK